MSFSYGAITSRKETMRCKHFSMSWTSYIRNTRICGNGSRILLVSP